jgi:hypothetical protein
MESALRRCRSCCRTARFRGLTLGWSPTLLPYPARSRAVVGSVGLPMRAPAVGRIRNRVAGPRTSWLRARAKTLSRVEGSGGCVSWVRFEEGAELDSIEVRSPIRAQRARSKDRRTKSRGRGERVVGEVQGRSRTRQHRAWESDQSMAGKKQRQTHQEQGGGERVVGEVQRRSRIRQHRAWESDQSTAGKDQSMASEKQRWTHQKKPQQWELYLP